MVPPSEPYEEFPSIIPKSNQNPRPKPRKEPKDTANMSKEGETKKYKKGFLPGIWSAKDGPGPAAWRRAKGPVRGLVKRKDEGNNRTGLMVSNRYANHAQWGDDLPPLSEEGAKRRAERKAKEERKAAKAAGGGKDGKK